MAETRRMRYDPHHYRQLGGIGMGGKRKPGGGRPPKLSEAQVAHLREYTLAHPELSLGDLTRKFCEHAGVSLSASTLRSYLKAAGVTRSLAPVQENAPGSGSKSETPVTVNYTEQHRDAGDEGRYPHGLTDAEWALVSDLFRQVGPGRPSKHSRRAMVDACFYVVRTGCPWRMLPRDMPPWQTVYSQFRRWSAAGAFEQTYDVLRARWREREGRAASPTATVIDAQSVKTSPQGGPKGYDAGKKVKGRKRHLATDTLGLLLVVLVTVASVQDRDAAEPLVAAAKEKVPTLVKGFADGGYAGRGLDRIRDNLGVDIEVVRHPGNRNVGRWHDAQLPLPLVERSGSGITVLPRRWVIERTNSWTVGCRRLTMDHDRRVDVASGWIWLAHMQMLARRIAYADAQAHAA